MFEREDENYIYEVVARNIKTQRKLHGLTQQQLADKIHYSTQFISNIESKNFQTFSLGTVWKISLTLNLDMHVLFQEHMTEDKNKRD